MMMGRSKSRRIFTPQNTGSGPHIATTDFGGGGGGAMSVFHERSWAGPADNSCVLSATGQVVDTGIGIMPALDLARQRGGLPTSSELASIEAAHSGGVTGAGGALGAVGGQGTPTRLSPVRVESEGVGTGLGGVMAGKRRRAEAREDHWADDNEEPNIAPYLLGREDLGESLGKGWVAW